MGRYDGPHFHCEENLVSVWAAKCPISQVPDDYFEENYGGDDDDPFNQFSTDFGFGYYDHDFVEGAALEKSAPIEQIIETASYGQSFANDVKAGSEVKNTEHVFLMYNFNYDPSVTGVRESKYYKFLGVFKYDPDA
ncbi:MAG: immunity 22 family protein [Burkholderiales bacterium]|nr:immunity 22 family protein [Burkholderiales bacterium]